MGNVNGTGGSGNSGRTNGIRLDRSESSNTGKTGGGGGTGTDNQIRETKKGWITRDDPQKARGPTQFNVTGTEAERRQAYGMVNELFKLSGGGPAVNDLLAKGAKLEGNSAWMSFADAVGGADIPFETARDFIMARTGQKDQMWQDVRLSAYNEMINTRGEDLTPQQTTQALADMRELQGTGRGKPQVIRTDMLFSLAESGAPVKTVLDELKTIPTNEIAIKKHAETLTVLMGRGKNAAHGDQVTQIRAEAARLPEPFRTDLLVYAQPRD